MEKKLAASWDSQALALRLASKGTLLAPLFVEVKFVRCQNKLSYTLATNTIVITVTIV